MVKQHPPLAYGLEGPVGCTGLVVRLFGRLELCWGSDPLPAPQSPIARSLLAYLIIRGRQSTSRDTLAGVFWPERSDSAARKALSQSLWQIRGALDPAGSRLETDLDLVTIALQPDDWFDVAAFEEILQRWERLLVGGAFPAPVLPECLMDLNLALEHYRGDLVEDCYDDWIVPYRERLRERTLWVLEKLILLNKLWGDHHQALAHAQRLATADPLRESVHRELMRLYHILGRDRAALKQYSNLCWLLEKELGDKPAAATTALYQELLAAENEPAAALMPLTARSACRAILRP